MMFTCFSHHRHIIEWMNENFICGTLKLPHKTLRVHSARYTQCIHVGSHRLNYPKTFIPVKYKQPLPTPQDKEVSFQSCERMMESSWFTHTHLPPLPPPPPPALSLHPPLLPLFLWDEWETKECLVRVHWSGHSFMGGSPKSPKHLISGETDW